MRYPGFVGPSARARSKIACDDRTVNLFIEKNDSGTAKAPYTMYRTPGYSQFCTSGLSNPVRGEYTLNGASFAVIGNKLYQLPFVAGGSMTLLATGINNPDDSPVTISGNGDGGFQLVIAAAGSLYCYDIPTATLTLIPGVSATQALFMNATFFALDPNTSTLFASATEDGSTWNLADVFQRSSSADKILAFAQVGTEIWIFGSQTTTVLYAVTADFPFAPNPNAFIQRGITAPWSLAVVDNAPIWLGQTGNGGGTVYRAQGYSAQPISSSALEYAISQMSTTLDAEATVYHEDGNEFYILNFPTAQQTWVYDLTEGLWHERGEWNGLDYDHLPIRGAIYTNEITLVGSLTSGVIYHQSLAYTTETDGETGIRWMRRAPHLCEEKVRNTYVRLELDAEVGVGLSTTVAAEADPQVYLRYSDDGGQSFGNVRAASMGPVGAYGTRLFWPMLGQARDRVFEVYGAAKVITALIDAYLTIRPGTS